MSFNNHDAEDPIGKKYGQKREVKTPTGIYENFFDWWESFTELAYSKNLEIAKKKEDIREIWWNKKDLNINDAIKDFTR